MLAQTSSRGFPASWRSTARNADAVRVSIRHASASALRSLAPERITASRYAWWSSPDSRHGWEPKYRSKFTSRSNSSVSQG